MVLANRPEAILGNLGSQSSINHQKSCDTIFLHTSAKQSMSPPRSVVFAIALPMGITCESKVSGWRGGGGVGTAGIDSYITKIKNIKRHYDDHMAIKKQSFTKKSKSQLSKYRYLKNTGIYPYTATA